MQSLTRISIAVICALGVTASIAQTVQPRVQGQTQARPPLQTAQAPGGAAPGASTSAVARTSAGGTVAGAVAFVAVGVAAVAATDTNAAVTHTP